MTSKYDEIYSCFLSKITEYKFMSLPQDDVYAMMCGWLHSAVSKPYIRRIFSSIKLDDEIMVVDYEVVNSVDEDADREYITELLGKAMVIEWLEPQVKSTLNISQAYMGKEQKYFSQAQHMSVLQNMLEDAKLEIRRMIRDHGYFFRSYGG